MRLPTAKGRWEGGNSTGREPFGPHLAFPATLRSTFMAACSNDKKRFQNGSEEICIHVASKYRNALHFITAAVVEHDADGTHACWRR